MNGIAKYHIGLIAPNSSDKRHLVLPLVAKKAIGQAQIFAHLDTEDFVGSGRLGGPNGRGTTGAQFASRKIDNANSLAHRHRSQQRASARHFYVVWVSAQRQNIQFHHRFT